VEPHRTDARDGRGDWLEGVLGVLAPIVPFGLAVARAASSAQWRSDIAWTRDLGLVSVGLGGGVSMVATQAAALLPIGSRPFRAAFVPAVALAVAAWLLRGMTREVLARMHVGGRLAEVLAVIATWTAALAATWQGEGTVAGGAMVACALGFATLRWAQTARAGGRGARSWLGGGALLGASLLESPAVGVAVALALVAHALAAGPWGPTASPRGGRAAFAAGFVGTAGLLAAPWVARPLAPRGWADVGRLLSPLATLGNGVGATSAVGAWTQELGLVTLGLAVLGALLAMTGRARALVAPLLVVAGVDVLGASAGLLGAEGGAGVRALVLGGMGVAGAVGVAGAASWLRAQAFPFARAASVLVVVFPLTLAALSAEEATFAADRSGALGAEEWTDQALGAVEPSAAVLATSPAVAWRLWAAMVVRGERPDVLVVPVPLLGQGRVAAGLLGIEPAVEPLLRDYALTGGPSELALSKLADARPLHVELDGDWSKRLVLHMTVDGMWLEFAPQPLGPSDRRQAAAATLAPISRVLGALAEGSMLDTETSMLVSRVLARQAWVLSTLGEHDAARSFLEEVALLPSGSGGRGGVIRRVSGPAGAGSKRAR
jgi:hypothetical protein